MQENEKESLLKYLKDKVVFCSSLEFDKIMNQTIVKEKYKYYKSSPEPLFKTKSSLLTRWFFNDSLLFCEIEDVSKVDSGVLHELKSILENFKNFK